MLKKALQICLVLVVFFFSIIPVAGAQTNVTQKNKCYYQVKVNLVFDFKDQAAKNKAEQLLAQWYQGMDNVWNKAQANFQSGCQVEYIFDFKKMADNKTCSNYPQDHCISVVSDNRNKRGHLADASKVAVNSGKNSKGEWTTQINGINAAHEVGHMLGLNDEYYYEIIDNQKKWINKNYKTTGPQSIMAQVWGNVSVLPEHTKQIIDQAGFKSDMIYIATPEKITTENKLPKIKNNYKHEDEKINTDRISLEKLIGNLIKGETDPAVYLVDEQGMLRHLANEQVASKIAGQDWNSKIIWFNDAIIYTYQFGEKII